MKDKKLQFLSASLAACVISAMSANGALLIYEGFQYGVAGSDRSGADLLDGQPDAVGGDTDATGLGGVWLDSAGPNSANDNLFLQSGSLSFGGLATSGNSVRSDTNSNNDIFSRAVTADLDAAPELWFTFLADKLQNNFDAAEGGLVIANMTVSNARITELGGGGLQGFGIAPTTAGNNWTAYGFDSSGKTEGTDILGVAVGGGDTHLLGGQIQFGAGAGGADIFNFYNYQTAAVGDRTLVESIEVNVDESLLNTLNLTRQVNTHYDEIRFATTEAEALAIPEPAVTLLGALGVLLLFRRRR